MAIVSGHRVIAAAPEMEKPMLSHTCPGGRLPVGPAADRLLAPEQKSA
jgi:hypothetical protein